MRKFIIFLFAGFFASIILIAQPNSSKKLPQVTVANGRLEGSYISGISEFKGIPFAAPPVGKFRWREPQPVQNWPGIRPAKAFGPRAMQLPLYSDMIFRSNGMSEDCLYLNVWTPAKTFKEKLPVLVYFYGGGLTTGDGSEYRYDGESMARLGIVAVTVNYRLNVFGFLSHPTLTKESPHHASGNYGLLDQAAALQWVAKNISAFGGDPNKITIAGESAGSMSVSALIASPLSKNLLAGAIGESGSILSRPTATQNQAEEVGVRFAGKLGVPGLEELRAIPAEKILEATKGFSNFPLAVDGYFFPKDPIGIYQKGEQAPIPLLYGWNTLEGSYQSILRNQPATIDNYAQAVKARFGDRAGDILALYKPKSDEEVKQVATELATDQFMGFSTWRWGALQAKTSGHPTYRYLFGRPRPAAVADTSANPYVAPGAVHSAEIEYAMGNLPTNRVYDWQPADYRVSQIFQDYFVNFIKTGNPNGLGLPAWPAAKPNMTSDHIFIDAETGIVPDSSYNRYMLWERLSKQQ